MKALAFVLGLTLVACLAAACGSGTKGDLVSLPTALSQGMVEAEFTSTGGASGGSIILRIRRLVEDDMTIEFPSGIRLVNPNPDEQDMVVRQSLHPVVLTNDEWHEHTLEAYCLEAQKDNPTEGVVMSPGGQAGPRVRAVLDAIDEVVQAEGDIAVIQVAVWAITDNIAFTDLPDLGFRLSRGDVETVRTIFEEAGLDPSNFRLFEPAEPAVRR